MEFEDFKDRIREKLPLIGFLLLFIFGIILIIIASKIKVNKTNNNNSLVNDNGFYYIDLVGNTTVLLYLGENYNEPGYSAHDVNNNDLTSKVEVKSNLNTSKLGNYSISYSLKNITKIRKIKVIERKLYVDLLGEEKVYINIGSEYTDAGYVIADPVDGEAIKEKVTVKNNVDTSKAGTYQVTYTAVNSKGVRASVTRTVVVISSDFTLTLNNTSYTNKNVKINLYTYDNYFDYYLLPNKEKITNKSYSYEVSNNGTYSFTLYNKYGGTISKSITVNNIDKTAPSGTCSGSYENNISTININANDNIGIDKYIINNTTYYSNPIKIYKEMSSVTITIYDKVGNTSKISCNLTNNNKQTNNNNNSNNTNNNNNYNQGYLSRKVTDTISVNYYTSIYNKSFSFWLYVPSNYKENMPMIIYLPGLGERGNDYYDGTFNAVNNGPIREVGLRGYNYNAIIVHAQVPENDYVYDYLLSYMELLKKLSDNYKVDIYRVSIMGFSHGCYGLMNWIPKFPYNFAAAVPIGCDPKDRAQYFVNTPTWTFVGTGDGDGTMQPFVNQINNLGGHAWHTKVSYSGHNIVGDEYSILRDSNYNVINWMISQSKR